MVFPSSYTPDVGVSQLPSGSWRVRLQIDGQRFARTFPSKVEALTWEASLRGGLRPTGLTVEEYLTAWLATVEGSVKANTLASYRQAVTRAVPVLGAIPLIDLTSADVQRWINAMKGDLSAKSIRTYRTALVTALGDAVERRLIPTNVAAGRAVRLPRQPSEPRPVWTPEEARTFLAGLDVDDPLRPIVTVAVTTGLRRGEVLGLKWTDLDGHTASISRQVTVEDNRPAVTDPKSARSRRRVALLPETVAVLEAWRAHLEAAGVSSPWIFPGTRETSEPLHPARVSRLFDAAVRSADVPTISFHDLRHTFATQMLRTGAPITTVSAQLGHSSVSVTADLYQHVDVPMLGEAISGAGDLLP